MEMGGCGGQTVYMNGRTDITKREDVVGHWNRWMWCGGWTIWWTCRIHMKVGIGGERG